MKMLNQMILVIIGLFLFTGCARDMILEKNHVYSLKTECILEHGEEYLIVSGLCGHSAYGVKSISSQKLGNKVIITIVISCGLRGDFKIKIKLDKDVREVLLGNDGSVIWTRNVTPI